MATLLMRPAEGGGGGADKKRRARKGKNAQKKQPQRGLGVAQLEKLRLQEQSLLCASPSYSLRLCPTSEHPLARCDSDVSQTMLSLANASQSAGGGGSSPGVSRFGALGVHSSSTLSLSSVVPDKKLGSVESDVKHLASRTLAGLVQPSKFSPANASFYSNVLATSQLQMFDNQIQQGQPLKGDDRRAGETGNAPVFVVGRPSTNTTSTKEAESHLDDAGFKLHPAFKDVQRIPLNLTDPHYFEAIIGPDVPHLPRRRIELPVVGASPSIDRSNSTKELSSFQNFPSQAWSSPEKVSGRKRPWLALQQENTRQLVHPHCQALDLNAPAGENEEQHSPRLSQAGESRVGAHYTTGIVRSALGNSCTPPTKIAVSSPASQWQDGGSPSSGAGYLSDMGRNLENGIVLSHCTSLSSVKDRCSNASGATTYFSPNRTRRCNNPETPLQAERESISSSFLTLGISSSSYSGNGWNEPEESSRDTNYPMHTNDFSRFKQGSSTMGCEGDGISFQRRCKQQDLGVDLEGSKCFAMEYYAGSRRHSPVLPFEDPVSHHSRLSSLSSMVSSADHNYRDHFAKSPRIVEESLDLRLKLAL